MKTAAMVAFAVLVVAFRPGESETGSWRARAPGLLLTLSSTGKSPPSDQRAVRLVALHVPAEASASAGLAPGPFSAVFTGWLNLDLRAQLTFSAEGRGFVRVRIKDEVVFEGDGEDLNSTAGKAARVRKGENPITVEYRSPPSGDATLRLYWKGEDFVREPIPPSALTHDPETPDLARSTAWRRGREAFVAYQCRQCHDVGIVANPALPELSLRAPSLQNIGDRVERSFLAAWIADPARFRPHPRMPAISLPSGQGSPMDLAAALSELRSSAGTTTSDIVDEQRVATGGALFADLGCIACHRLPKTEVPADDRLPLDHVGWKFRPGALAAFLVEPTKFHSAARMPDFQLSEEEALVLEAFLRARSARKPTEVEAGDSVLGQKLLLTLGCAQCHDGVPNATPSVRRPLSEHTLDKFATGCLSESAERRGQAPRYTFLGTERSDLETFLRSGLPSLAWNDVPEVAERLIRDLRCTACHGFDSTPDRWASTVLETHAVQAEARKTEKLSQARPELTWIGERLHSAWTRKLFQGEPGPRMRPWLHARMPAFASRADALATGLVAMQGFPETSPIPSARDPEASKIGEYLVSRAGFGCTACHFLEGTAPYAEFEVGAVDLARTHARVREEFYTRWMWKPQRIHQSSRMPVYATPQDGITSQDAFEGNATQQFAVMWSYLSTLK